MRLSEKVLGLDLAGSPRRKTGYAYLRNGELWVGVLHTDEEIIKLASNFKLVAVDAPLSLPEGRESLEKPGPHFRECDLKLRKRGIKFFPVTLGAMRSLTQRGMSLKEELLKMGVEVIETYPGGLYDLFGVSRKDKGQIYHFFRSLGFELKDRRYSKDELDAVACLISGLRYLSLCAEAFEGKEGTIWI